MGFADLVPQGLRPILRSAKRKRAEILLNLSSFPFLSFFSLLEADTPNSPLPRERDLPNPFSNPCKRWPLPRPPLLFSGAISMLCPAPARRAPSNPGAAPAICRSATKSRLLRAVASKKRHSITKSRPITHAKRLSQGLSRATTWENGAAALCGGSARRESLSPKATFRNSMAVFRNPRLGWATFRSREAKRLPATCGGQSPCTIDTNNPLMRSGHKGHRESYFSSRISKARL